MAMTKSKAVLMVADGKGGMTKLEDRRFEPPGMWPIRFRVPKGDQADTWMRYLNDECSRRGWSHSNFGELDRSENSGTITINAGQQQLAIVWTRKRGGQIKARARSSGAEEFPVAEARVFLERVNARCRSGVTEHIHCRRYLQYTGKGWCGEFWLDDTLRLGPPSRQDPPSTMKSPRIIVVDAMVECVGQSDATWAFNLVLRKLAAFLSIVMRKYVRIEDQGRVWTWTSGPGDCAVRQLGYMEAEDRPGMPGRGAARPIRLTTPDEIVDEQTLPTDIAELWGKFLSLDADHCQQFLQAAAKWQEAMMVWGETGERSTLSFALMVVACEALKPPGPAFWDHNVYDVVEALLGKPVADRLRRLPHPFTPKNVRGTHLHRGVFHGSEFLLTASMSSYRDPSFLEACHELGRVTLQAVSEWLRRGGAFTMPVLKRRNTFRGLVREYAFTMLPLAVAVGAGAGWVARIFWLG